MCQVVSVVRSLKEMVLGENEDEVVKQIHAACNKVANQTDLGIEIREALLSEESNTMYTL